MADGMKLMRDEFLGGRVEHIQLLLPLCNFAQPIGGATLLPLVLLCTTLDTPTRNEGPNYKRDPGS